MSHGVIEPSEYSKNMFSSWSVLVDMSLAEVQNTTTGSQSHSLSDGNTCQSDEIRRVYRVHDAGRW